METPSNILILAAPVTPVAFQRRLGMPLKPLGGGESLSRKVKGLHLALYKNYGGLKKFMEKIKICPDFICCILKLHLEKQDVEVQIIMVCEPAYFPQHYSKPCKNSDQIIKYAHIGRGHLSEA